MPFLRKYTGPLKTAARKRLSAIAIAVDAYFNYVTLLLSGDGTNGAQNNTFLDSSTNNFTITRNGNTTQGSFSPYGSNWSNYFDGTGDRLSIASASALNIGSADMTMEFWMLIPSAFPSNYRVLFAKGTNTSGGNSYAIEGMSSGALTLWVNTDGSDGWNLFSGTTIGTPTVGAWNHVVVCRSGTTWYSFMNGTRVLNTTGAGTVTASSTAVTIGDFGTAGFEYTGYISNLRLVNGTAIYANATTCTVPTTPLTAVTNTSLLTCQSNRFIDNSTNAFAITTTGTPSVQRFNPFGASTAYSTSVIGGSGYFDGTGDYLTTPSSSALGFGTGDFTIECWTYLRDNNALYVFDMRFSSGADTYVYINASTLEAAVNGVSLSVSGVNFLNNWSHIAIVRASGTVKIYVNGVQQATDSSSGSIANSGIAVGARYTGSESFNGYISNFRIVKGTAVYTSAFTPPTAPVTAITNTSLLLNYTNGAIFDNAMMNDLETVGNAQISTSVVMYGTGSLAFVGSGDYLAAPQTVNTDFGTGDFTVEFWANWASASSSSTLVCKWGLGSSNQYAWLINYNTSGNLWFYTGDSGSPGSLFTFGFTPTTSTWYHIAFTRSGSSLKCFVNGTQAGSTETTTQNMSAVQGTFVGNNPNSNTYFNGYIDDLRITKGYARYTANFTPPTAALGTISAP